MPQFWLLNHIGSTEHKQVVYYSILFTLTQTSDSTNWHKQTVQKWLFKKYVYDTTHSTSLTLYHIASTECKMFLFRSINNDTNRGSTAWCRQSVQKQQFQICWFMVSMKCYKPLIIVESKECTQRNVLVEFQREQNETGGNTWFMTCKIYTQ
jgi:hypothetical protein